VKEKFGFLGQLLIGAMNVLFHGAITVCTYGFVTAGFVEDEDVITEGDFEEDEDLSEQDIEDLPGPNYPEPPYRE
jgi:hypothetical protein